MVIKAEGTRGTSVISSMANADFNIPFFNIKWDPEIQKHLSKYQAGDYDHFAAVVGRRMCRVTASAPFKWSGVAATAPGIGKAIQMCGGLEAITTDVKYSPSKAADLQTHSLLIQNEVQGGTPIALGIQIAGAMANGKIIMDEVGMPLRLDLDIMGRFDGIVDIANGSILTHSGIDTPVADSVLSATITLATIAQRMSKFELDFGNTVEMELDPSTASGYLAAYIADRNPVGSYDHYADALATDASYTREAAGTESVFEFATSHFSLDANKVQEMSNTDGLINNAFAYSKAIQFNRDPSGLAVAWQLTHS